MNTIEDAPEKQSPDWNEHFICRPEEGILIWKDNVVRTRRRKYANKVVTGTLRRDGRAHKRNRVYGRSVVLMEKHYMMHRIIWEMCNGPIPDGLQIDHINGDPLDNRLANLRLATQSQNSMNSRRPSTNTSGYKGVSWSQREQKWGAQIGVNGDTINLGFYDDPREAHAAYRAGALKYHGEFAKPDSPTPSEIAAREFLRNEENYELAAAIRIDQMDVVATAMKLLSAFHLSMCSKEGPSDEGETCSVCSRKYQTVFKLDENTWSVISGRTDGGGLMCPSCSDRLAREKGIELYWSAAPSDYPGSVQVQYRSAVSGLYYTHRSAAGDIDAIKVGDELYELGSPKVGALLEAGDAMYRSAEFNYRMADGRMRMAHACEKWRIAKADASLQGEGSSSSSSLGDAVQSDGPGQSGVPSSLRSDPLSAAPNVPIAPSHKADKPATP